VLIKKIFDVFHKPVAVFKFSTSILQNLTFKTSNYLVDEDDFAGSFLSSVFLLLELDEEVGFLSADDDVLLGSLLADLKR
jgi:hypothetical protein